MASGEFIIKLIVIEATSLSCCSLETNIKIMRKKIIQSKFSTGFEGADLLHNCWKLNISIFLRYIYRMCYIINVLTESAAQH
jgi:hypothetical protein